MGTIYVDPFGAASTPNVPALRPTLPAVRPTPIVGSTPPALPTMAQIARAAGPLAAIAGYGAADDQAKGDVMSGFGPMGKMLGLAYNLSAPLRNSLTPQMPQLAPQAPAQAPAPAPAPQARTVDTSGYQMGPSMAEMPKLKFNARSGTMAYDVAPGTNWRPKFEGRGENPNYQGPLSHVSVRRNPKTGTLEFSGAGRQVNQDGTEYVAPQVPQSQMQRDVAEIAGLFGNAGPQTREDMAMFQGLLGEMMKAREGGEDRSSRENIAEMGLLAAEAGKKPPAFKDQLGQYLSQQLAGRYKDQPDVLLEKLMQMYVPNYFPQFNLGE